MAKEFDLFAYLLAKQNAGGNTEEILADLLTLTTPSEETIEAALTQLGIDKSDLVVILNDKGVEASDSETFTELVPKVGTISSGGGGYDGVAVIPILSITEVMLTNTLGGLSQSTEPTTTGENPQTYQDEQGVWHNLYWLDTSVSPNIWKKYNIETQTWETV